MRGYTPVRTDGIQNAVLATQEREMEHSMGQ